MPNYIRPRIPGATIFFTVSLQDRTSDLLVRHVSALRAAVRVTKSERPFHIEAWVVLPDHLHCIWTLPEGDANYPTRWRLIKSRFSRAIAPGLKRPSQLLRQERGIWQRRYWEHHIRDPSDFATHLNHCWTSPVKHGLVHRPEDWPFSSIHQDPRYRAVRVNTHPTPMPHL